MKPQDRYFIGPALRDKLRDIVRVHDTSAFGGGAARIPTAHQEMMRGVAGSLMRMGQFHGAWPKGTKKSVSLYGEQAEVIDVVNFMIHLTTNCGWRRCIVAKMTIPTVVNGNETGIENAWTLVSVEVA